MNEPRAEVTEVVQPEDALSRIELQFEHEKLKLERERILLERERLEATRERYQAQQRWFTDKNGKLSVTLSNMILVSIICTLIGGVLGSLSTSTHLDRRKKARLQEMMQTLANVAPTTEVEGQTNAVQRVAAEMPTWVQVMKPQGGAHAGISLVVIQ